MSQHPSEKVLESYCRRTLAPQELLNADRHIEECDQCRARLAHFVRMDTSIKDLANVLADDAVYDEHLNYEQLESYVDGKMEEVAREIADVHFTNCLSCRDQKDDLRVLRASLNLEPERSGPAEVNSVWKWLGSTLWAKAAVAATGLLLVAIGLWFVFLSKPDPANNVAGSDQTAPPHQGSEVVPDQTDTSQIAELNQPDKSEPEMLPPVVSLLDGGSRIELSADGNLAGIQAGRMESRIKAVLSGQDIRVGTAQKELRAQSGVLMSGTSPGIPFALSSPVGRVIKSDRPQLRWQPLANAESYTVAIYDEDFNKVAASPPLKQTTWTSSQPLRRGATYNWQVTALKDDQEVTSPVRPAPDAKFKVMDAATLNDLNTAARMRSHLLLGTIYAEAGMLAEAEREFQLLVRQNPRSELARKLLRKVQAQK